MPELEDGETAEVQGSAANPYVMKNVGGVYSCSCPAWRHQSLPLEARSCKHLRALRGEDVEVARVRAAGADLARRPTASRVSVKSRSLPKKKVSSVSTDSAAAPPSS